MNDKTRDILSIGLKDSIRYINDDNIDIALLACELFHSMCKEGNNEIKALINKEDGIEHLYENLERNNIYLIVYSCRLLIYLSIYLVIIINR